MPHSLLPVTRLIHCPTTSHVLSRARQCWPFRCCLYRQGSSLSQMSQWKDILQKPAACKAWTAAVNFRSCLTPYFHPIDTLPNHISVCLTFCQFGLSGGTCIKWCQQHFHSAAGGIASSGYTGDPIDALYTQIHCYISCLIQSAFLAEPLTSAAATVSDSSKEHLWLLVASTALQDTLYI